MSGRSPAGRPGWAATAGYTVGYTVGGHVLSSGSNLVLQIGVALSFTPSRFGTLVVALSLYYFALAMGRATVGDPLVAAAEPDDGAATGARWTQGAGRLLAIGAAAGAALAVLAAVGGGELRWLLLAVAVSVPALLVQDGYRYLAWA
ncbi:MAG: hypothetical protein AAFN30_14825, partial [Actinomycetota bacterium]